MTTDEPLERRRRFGGLAQAMVYGTFAVAAGLWIAVIFGAVRQKPGWEGWLSGIFGGGLLALLVALGGLWLTVALLRPGKRKEPDRPVTAGEVDPELHAVLEELEKARGETLQQINARAVWRVPLGIAGAIAIWVLGQFSDEPGDVFDLVLFSGFGGLAGYMWASLKLSNAYRRRYKEQVLPRLAKTFGDFTWRPAVMPDVDRLAREKVFRDFGNASADDEIVGKIGTCAVNIVEVKMSKRQGKRTVTVFDGLIVEIELPRDTGAVTAIVSDAGAFGNFADRMNPDRKRVALEDPVFEKVYEVYGTDQVAARALLHPAFMEKLLKLGELPDFQRPMALADGKKLTMVLPKRLGLNLFEAPHFRKPAASRETLTTLRKDIEAVIATAQALVALDHRFAGPAGSR